MPSINEQLGVPVLNNGMTTYQPSMYSGSTNNYLNQDTPVVVGTSYYQGADGRNSWSGCNSCGGFSGADGAAETLEKLEICFKKCAVLHPFNKDKKLMCQNDCKAKYNIQSLSDISPELKDKLPQSLGGTKDIRPEQTTISDSEKSTGLASMPLNTKIALGIGAVAIVGLAIFMVRSKK